MEEVLSILLNSAEEPIATVGDISQIAMFDRKIWYERASKPADCSECKMLKWLVRLFVSCGDLVPSNLLSPSGQVEGGGPLVQIHVSHVTSRQEMSRLPNGSRLPRISTSFRATSIFHPTTSLPTQQLNNISQPLCQALDSST